MHWRAIGPPRAGRARALAGVPEPAQRLLRRLRQRRRVALHRLRLHLGAALRRPAHGLHRRHRAWRPRTRTSSTWAAARASSARTCPPATACTSPPTRGKTWTHLGLRDTPDDRRRRRGSHEPEPALRRRAGPSLRAQRGARASSAPPTAARPSRRCCTRTSTPAATTSASTRRTRTSSTRRSGSSSRASGRAASSAAPGNGIFKSTDGGTTWKPLTEGLPERHRGQPRHRAQQPAA